MTMRSTHIIGLFALLLWGCSNSTPTQVPESNDEMIAAIVAATAGYEGNGLAAMIDDAVAIEAGWEIRDRSVAEKAAVQRRSYDSATGWTTVNLQRRSSRGDDHSEWNLDYRLLPGVIERVDSGTDAGGVVESRTRGIYRSDGLRLEGESLGRLQMLDPGVGQAPPVLSGEYRWSGASSSNGRREDRYADIVVRFNWQELQASRSSINERAILSGRCNVTVSLNGPEGAVVRNGSLRFKGDGRGVLVIGGKHYMLSI